MKLYPVAFIGTIFAANRLERGDEGARHLDQASLFSEVPA
jgi:hypothetical protein